MGDVLTSEEGLCHIGEWHSYHTLSLSRPSGGDESTIWSNMDRYGLSRFVLFIANIDTTWSWSQFGYLPDQTTVNGFLFEVDRRDQQRLPVLQAELVLLQEESPFRSKYLNAIREGAESLNSAQDKLCFVVKKCQQMESGLKNVLQAEQELERSLAETKKEVHSNKQKSNQLEKSLLTERQERKKFKAYLAEEKKSHEETTRDLWNSKQTSIELNKSLAVEREAREELKAALAQEQKAHEKTRRDLLKNEQRSHQLETVLTAQTHDEETERRLHSSEQRSHELEASLAAQTQARQKTERRLYSSEQRSRELEASLAAQTQARVETERRLHSSEQKSYELQTSLVAEQNAHEETRRHLTRSKHQNTLATVQHEDHRSSENTSCDWILGRDEVILSDIIIREGLWGRMVEGKFGRYKVAVTETRHLDILSPENRKLFEREMEMAFQCRYPCLLRFIGATNDDQSPLFVTELLETSLRAVLHERPLELSEISTIALDVAEGINYLHLHSPDPIVHGDISSANVLLWKKGADWRAKVSNCIADNVLQQSMAVSPFDVNYAAPEVRILHSRKVDVYSFGVLLCEMSIRETPDVNHRDNQIEKLPLKFRMFIRRCIREIPTTRPSMKENVEKIKNSHFTW